MHVTRFDDAKPYDARGHFNMVGLRLQGFDASPAENFWVGLSHFLPGGGAESSATPIEKVYVVVSGEVTIVTDAATDDTAGLRFVPPRPRRAAGDHQPEQQPGGDAGGHALSRRWQAAARAGDERATMTSPSPPPRRGLARASPRGCVMLRPARDDGAGDDRRTVRSDERLETEDRLHHLAGQRIRDRLVDRREGIEGHQAIDRKAVP